MSVEIERKFLVSAEHAEFIRKHSIGNDHIVQGYLSKNPTIRVRISVSSWLISGTSGDSYTTNTAKITIKGPGLSQRSEFEYDIPIDDANEIMKLATCVIEKRRYLIDLPDYVWEVDEFINPHKGLWLAEVELESLESEFQKPHFLGLEVTNDPHFTNVYLAANP